MNRIKNTLMLCLFALILVGCAGSTAGNGMRAAGNTTPAGDKWGPATTVPQMYMNSQGDRVGHYAPYFYPDGTGGGETR
jgi:hypothetical protein